MLELLFKFAAFIGHLDASIVAVCVFLALLLLAVVVLGVLEVLCD